MTSVSKLTVFCSEDERNVSNTFLRTQREGVIQSKETNHRILAIKDGLSFHPNVNFKEVSFEGKEEAKKLNNTLREIHDRNYLSFLVNVPSENKAHAHSIVNRHAAPGTKQNTSIDRFTYSNATQASLNSLCSALYLSQNKSEHVYSLCRPPGHHAGKSFFGGYCYLNNAAVAAYTLHESGVSPVCIIDIDYHVGNGTSDILSAHPYINFVSIHADTQNAFPFISNLAPAHPHHFYINVKKPPSCNQYMGFLTEAINFAKEKNAQALIISIGFDIISNDPHGGWTLPPEIFEEIGKSLAATELPLCFVQEGGYGLDNLFNCGFFLAKGLVKNQEQPQEVII